MSSQERSEKAKNQLREPGGSKWVAGGQRKPTSSPGRTCAGRPVRSRPAH